MQKEKGMTGLAALMIVRGMALFMAAIGTWILLERLALSWGEIDLNYLALFLKSKLASPLSAWLVAAALWIFSKPLARLISGQ